MIENMKFVSSLKCFKHLELSEDGEDKKGEYLLG